MHFSNLILQREDHRIIILNIKFSSPSRPSANANLSKIQSDGAIAKVKVMFVLERSSITKYEDDFVV